MFHLYKRLKSETIHQTIYEICRRVHRYNNSNCYNKIQGHCIFVSGISVIICYCVSGIGAAYISKTYPYCVLIGFIWDIIIMNMLIVQ